MKKFASLLCAVALVGTTFIPTVASANSVVNTELAGNSAEVWNKIQNIGTPMSDDVAAEMRGEGFLINWKSYFVGIAQDFGVAASVAACVIVTGGACGYALVASGVYVLFKGYGQGPFEEYIYVNARY